MDLPSPSLFPPKEPEEAPSPRRGFFFLLALVLSRLACAIDPRRHAFQIKFGV